MTNRQMADYYNGLYERADRLFSKAWGNLEQIFRYNVSEISMILSSLSSAAVREEGQRLYRTDVMFWFDDEMTIFRKVAFYKAMISKAITLSSAFVKKMRHYDQEADKDEANN